MLPTRPMSPHGSCRLCGTVTQLQASHLLPKAMYRALADPHQENRNPYLVDERGVVQTAK